MQSGSENCCQSTLEGFFCPYLSISYRLPFSTLGGLLFGYDQGIISGVIIMESFGARYPRIFAESGLKGWFVSTLLLAAWFGSLVNGPLADRIGRRLSIIVAVAVFTIGSIIQCAAMNMPMLFAGRAIVGLSIGQLTMVVPLYISEVSVPEIRGGLVVLQQLSIAIGVLVSYWVDYGTNYIGGTRCAPSIPYTGGSKSSPVFDPYRDIPPTSGCTGQSEVSWRLPLALQIVPGLILGIGMVFFPETPRWLLMKERDDESLTALAKLRRQPQGSNSLIKEYLEIRASIQLENSFAKDNFPGVSGYRLHAAEVHISEITHTLTVLLTYGQYISLLTKWPRFKRLTIGCIVMFFQQFMGCNAMIYYAPTIFSQLGLSGNTSSLLATGIYGIITCVCTLPALFFIDRVGRRPLLITGAIGTCISLVIVSAILGKYGSSLVDHKSAGWTGIAFIYIYGLNFSYSFAPIGWVLPSEIFNLSIRSKAISITTSTTWMCNFIIGLVTPDMLESLTWGTYIFFSAFCLLALVFRFFCIPETRGKTLEDMDLIFGDTAAHEEKKHIQHIEAELRGARLDTEPSLFKPMDEQIELV
ncbi:unnamed protein product [Penicillium salamii]|uniref:Major facilitator superfamily (MFS) profile domain-containing protein n=1 Tax=Penicillium salamii TaxID=1612424 RepID=A0A9W4K1I3_9EURO|nr:unnamed protein product [Penicillium salamii]CAG8155198.1 unnamed protein product [Penicillium salamii]CAG8352410.1 unnamed protein product [Penicillium salamii]CAG8431422.1 unnamed protein product [Penicillium salamii]CAG8654175.1 unnamed protein product [Penicillium salamii]